jgi:hypothetical protein
LRAKEADRPGGNPDGPGERETKQPRKEARPLAWSIPHLDTEGNIPPLPRRYRGVYQPSGRNVFKASITIGNRTRHLGYFDTAEEAARAYDRAATEAFGDRARLNFGGEA